MTIATAAAAAATTTGPALRLRKREAEKYAKRLSALAEFLKTLKPADYDHTLWFKITNEGVKVGSALGWAVESGLFNKTGLSMSLDNIHTHMKKDGRYFWPRINGTQLKTKEAAEEVFGPKTYDAIFAIAPFESDNRVKPSDVAKRIEKFLASNYANFSQVA
jgi:hypothetical protein